MFCLVKVAGHSVPHIDEQLMPLWQCSLGLHGDSEMMYDTPRDVFTGILRSDKASRDEKHAHLICTSNLSNRSSQGSLRSLGTGGLT
jgi:hypothetical protein